MIAGREELVVEGLPPPISHYTHGTTYGDLVFASGCTGADASGRLTSEDPADQARQALRNVEAILRAAGASLADVLKVTVYLTDVDDRVAVDQARREAFGAARPASTLVEVSRLARPGAKVEFEAIAGRRRAARPPEGVSQ